MHFNRSFSSLLPLAIACILFFSCQRNGQTSSPGAPTTTETTVVNEEPDTVAIAETPAMEGSDTILPGEELAPTAEPSDYVAIITNQADGTFGYDILHHGALLISQPNIPGTSGTAGFKTKEQAYATAQLVTEKLEKGISPPTVTEKELKKILNN